MIIKADTRNTDWYSLLSKLEIRVISSALTADYFNSAVGKSIPRDWFPIVFEEDKEPLPMRSADNVRGFGSSNQIVDGWITLIKEKLYANPAVEDIFVSIEDNDVDVWVVIPKRNISILRQLVESEGQIIEMLISGERPAFLIDFHIIYRYGCNLEEVVPTRAIRLPK